MPVGRTEDDGRAFRTYRGKPEPLGTLTEWTCPSCGEKVSGVRFEAGCPHCGVGVPSNEPPVREPQRREPLTEGLPGRLPTAPTASVVAASGHAGKPGDLRSVAPALVVTRIIQYVCKPGMEAAFNEVLRRSLVGRMDYAWGSLTATIVDDVSVRQQDILGLAGRQPGVWLGGPEVGGFDSHRAAAAPENPRGTGEREIATPPRVIPYAQAAQDALQYFEEHQMERIVPPTGPQFSVQDAKIASLLVDGCGMKVAYTLAIALQSLAASADDTDPLVLTSEDCYALANAIMQYVPREYVEPELPPPPPPVDPAGTAAQHDADEARARIRAIQEASKPTASFRE